MFPVRGPLITAGNNAAYEITLALHALAVLTAKPGPANLARLQELIRYVAARVGLLTSDVSIPAHPLRCQAPEGQLCGIGALLAEDMAAGTTWLSSELAALRAADLIDPLYAIVDRVEEIYGTSWLTGDHRTQPLGLNAPRGAVHVLLQPVAGWSVIATLTAEFSTSSGRALGEVAAPVPKAVPVMSRAWSPLSNRFLDETDRALFQARRLVSALGRPQPPFVGAVFDHVAVWRPSTVRESVSAAAVALTYLAEQAELPTPAESGVLVLAGIALDGRWLPAGDDEDLEAAQAAGLRVLRSTSTGWGMGESGGWVEDGDTSLNGAARLLWGEDWTLVQHRWDAEALQAHDWRVVYARLPAPWSPSEAWGIASEEFPFVEAPQVNMLLGQYILQSKLAMILSGPPNSGKSVIARQLAQRLETQRWKILVLTPRDRGLPPAGDLPVIVRSALRLTGITPDAKTLVVIEDMHPLERGRLGSAVSSLATELGVSVLALARYAEGSGVEWDSGTVSPMTAVAGTENVAALAEQMLNEHPESYGPAANLLPALIEASRGDLWLLSRLMSNATFKSEQGNAIHAGEVLTNYIKETLTDVSAAHQEALRQVAAVSLFGEAVPAEYVPQAALDVLANLGVHHHNHLAHVPSHKYARLLFEALSPKGEPGADSKSCETRALPLLATYLLRLLAESCSSRVLGLLRVCRAHDPTALATLLETSSVSGGLAAWSKTARPSTVAAVLRICDQFMEPGWVPALLPDVLRRVPGTEDLDARQLSSVLRLISQHRHHVQDTEVLTEFMNWLSDPGLGLSAVLRRPASVADRYFAARNLFRLYEKRSPELIIAQSAAFLQGVDPTAATDLVHVRKLDVLLARCYRESGQELDGRRPLEGYPQLQDLLESQPASDARVSTVMAWLSLRLHFYRPDWVDLIGSHEGQLRAAFGRATGSEITMVLTDLAENHRGFCTMMLNRLRLGDQLRVVLRNAAPAEAAHLISTIGHIHSVTIRNLLYREINGALIADEDLARILAARIGNLKDGKGAGMLLSSAHSADELYCSTEDSFAGRLAEHLGEAFAVKQVRNERRPSMLYYLLRGLWEAQASYRWQVEDLVFQLIVDSIKAPGRTNRSWTAQLALLLAVDDYFGEKFLNRLAQEIDPAMLAQRMTQPGLRGDAIVHLHRLGQAINPDIPRHYRARFRMEHLLLSLTSLSASSVAKQLRVVATTLRMSGEESANTILLQTFKETVPSWDWGSEISKARNASELTMALNDLHKLDPGTASEAINGLKTTQEGHSFSVLQEYVLRSATDPAQAAELLQSAETISHGLGQQLLTHLQYHPSLWTTFTKELQYEQDPIQQGKIGRQLASLGVIPRQGNLFWMKSLFNDRWLKVATLLASPRAIAELLKLTYIWDPVWGHQLAASIDQGKLLSRVRLGAIRDLRDLPGLLHILTLTGRHELAQEIIDRLAAFDPDDLARKLGLASGSQLLRRLQVHRRSEALPFGSALGRALGTTMKRHLVIHPGRHWKAIGWAAQVLREVGLEAELPVEPPLFPPNPALGAELCWAATWLPESPWTQSALDAALPVFLRASRSWCQAEHVAMALIAGARSGRLDDLSRDETYWSLASEAGLGTLTLAHREGTNHDTLMGLLSSLKPAVHKRLKSPVHRIDPWLLELRSLLNQTPGPTDIGPASLFKNPDGL